MKLAFSTLGCPDWSVEQVAEQALRAGYTGIELRLLGPDLIPADLPEAERRRVLSVFDGAGLAICCVGTSARFSSAEPEARAENERLAMRFLELAADWRCPLIRVFGGVFPDGVPAEQVIAYVAESLERVGRRGEALGVTAVLETHDGFSAGATVAAALAQVSSPFVGALWDTHHPYRMGESAAQTMALLGNRLRHVHIKDARRRGDGWELVLLGEGEVPVAEALQAIQAGGYDGWYSVEWEKKWHPEIPDPEIALPQHAEVLRRLL
jgi:sugar phosphate isomerase/epimerase